MLPQMVPRRELGEPSSWAYRKQKLTDWVQRKRVPGGNSETEQMGPVRNGVLTAPPHCGPPVRPHSSDPHRRGEFGAKMEKIWGRMLKRGANGAILGSRKTKKCPKCSTRN